MKKTIAYQGVQGAFSYSTAVNQFGENNTFQGLPTFSEVFEKLNSGEVELAVIPIENSLIGSIYENYDLLNQYEIKIIGESYTKIEHCLLAIPQQQIKDRLRQIKKVFSHTKALEQCSQFFKKHPWIEAIVHIDTAAAAKEIAAKNDPECAAIASELAGKFYGLEILQKGIEDDPENYTRFVTITKNEIRNDSSDKCSLVLQLKHVPGSLVGTLNLFAEQGMNLTKIESRPIKGKPFEYMFYVDFEFSGHERKEVEVLVESLLNKVQIAKVLGFYKRGLL